MLKTSHSILDRYQEEDITANLPVNIISETTEKIQPEKNPEEIDYQNVQEELELRPLLPGSIKEIINMNNIVKHAFLPFWLPKGSPPTNISDIISKFGLFTFLITTVGFGKNLHLRSAE